MAYSQAFGKQWLFSSTAEAPLLLVSQDKNTLLEAIKTTTLLTVCEETTPPCGVCLACTQAGNHIYPDILELSSDEKTIPLKAVQELLQSARQTPWHRRKLLIIPMAERLTREAVSALLKTLEEPTATSRTLLTTSFKNRLLKTLLSRCHIMAVPALTQEKNQIAQIVSKPRFGRQTEPLNEEQLLTITSFLEQSIKTVGFSPALYRSFLRLRDYYKITSARGNTKLAGEVLLATLEQCHDYGVLLKQL